MIRGQSGFRVKTTENGLGTADVATIGPDHGVPVNPLMAQSIEVLRGPATLRYGGSAIGGVVNALINRIPSRVPANLVSGEVLGIWGSDADRREGAFLLDGASGRLGWHLDGARQRAQDYDAPGGTGHSKVRNSGTDGSALAGGLAWLGGDFRLGVARSRFENEYGIPEDAHVVDLRKNVWHWEADWLEPVSGIERIELRGASSDYGHGEYENNLREGTVDSDEGEWRLEVLHEPLLESGSLRGALGGHHIRSKLEVGGLGDPILEPSQTKTWAVYAIEEWLLSDRLTAELAARVERVEIEGSLPGMAQRTRRFHPFNASLGIVYHPADGISVALRASSTERAPNAAELFYLGEHHATGTYEIGDPELEVERADAAELTLHIQRGRLSLTASLFYTDYKDYIDLVHTGRTVVSEHDNDEDDHEEDDHEEDGHEEDGHEEDGHEENEDDHAHDGLIEAEFLQKNAVFYGGELWLDYELFEWAGIHFGLDAQFDAVRGRLDRGNVPRQPPFRYGAGLHLHGERFHGRLGFLRNTRQRRTGALETPTDAYTMVDASVALRLISEGERSLELHLNGRNLLDERARNHLNFRKDLFVLPGRSIRVSLHGRF